MKKIQVIVIIVIGLIMCGWCSHYEHHYTRKAVVTNVECIEVTVKDNSGHYWTFMGNGYNKGDKLTLVMNDNMTPNNIYDDIVKEVK